MNKDCRELAELCLEKIKLFMSPMITVPAEVKIEMLMHALEEFDKSSKDTE